MSTKVLFGVMLVICGGVFVAVNACAAQATQSGNPGLIEPHVIDISIFERNKTRTEAEIVADLGNDAAIVRSACVQELGRRDAVNRKDAVAELLTDGVEFVRLRAALVLVEMGDDRGLPVLRKTVAAEGAPILHRMDAAIGLCKLGHDDGVAFAKQHLSSSNSLVRKEAVEVVSRSKDATAGYAALAGTAMDTNQSVRWGSVKRLGEMGSPRAVELLVAFSTDQDAVIRSAVARALVKTGMCDAVPVLLGMLSDASRSVAVDASAALTDLTGHAEFDTPVSAYHAAAQGTLRDGWLAWWEQNKTNYPAGHKVTEPSEPTQ